MAHAGLRRIDPDTLGLSSSSEESGEVSLFCLSVHNPTSAVLGLKLMLIAEVCLQDNAGGMAASPPGI